MRDCYGALLVGERLHRPARGYWFVPGGRALKNKPLNGTFRRLTFAELGCVFERGSAKLLGVYEHFYTDSLFGDEQTSRSTHYVGLSLELQLAAGQSITPPRQQHGRYRWWKTDDMRSSNQVHGNTQAYLATLR